VPRPSLHGLEGAQLVGAYVIIAISFFFVRSL
jgi:hypothetical protein